MQAVSVVLIRNRCPNHQLNRNLNANGLNLISLCEMYKRNWCLSAEGTESN